MEACAVGPYPWFYAPRKASGWGDRIVSFWLAAVNFEQEKAAHWGAINTPIIESKSRVEIFPHPIISFTSLIGQLLWGLICLSRSCAGSWFFAISLHLASTRWSVGIDLISGLRKWFEVAELRSPSHNVKALSPNSGSIRALFKSSWFPALSYGVALLAIFLPHEHVWINFSGFAHFDSPCLCCVKFCVINNQIGYFYKSLV